MTNQEIKAELQKILRRAFDSEKSNKEAHDLIVIASGVQVGGCNLDEDFIQDMKRDLI